MRHICRSRCLSVKTTQTHARPQLSPVKFFQCMRSLLERRRTLPAANRWHPFTVSKMYGASSDWLGRWHWLNDCFTLLISTRHKALSSPAAHIAVLSAWHSLVHPAVSRGSVLTNNHQQFLHLLDDVDLKDRAQAWNVGQRVLDHVEGIQTFLRAHQDYLRAQSSA